MPSNQQSNLTETKLKFDDLHLDVLFLIFDELEFGDLVNVADTNLKLSYFAAEIFRQKFRNINHFDIEPNKYSASKVFKKTIRMHGYKLIVNALKHFGKNVQRITVDGFYLKPTQSAGVIGAINKYCSETLIELGLFWVEFNICHHFTQPFTKVKTLKFELKKKVAEPTKKLNKLFPNAEYFVLGIQPLANDSFTDCFFPHLTHVTLRIDYTINWKSKGEFMGEKLLKQNPQIQSIALNIQYTPVDILSSINQILPNLKYLKLWQCPTFNVVHFNNVKALNICENDFTGFEHIKFSRLEEIELDYFNYLHEKIFAFLKENENSLRQLDIVENSNSDDFQMKFESLIEALPNLMQISVMCRQRLSMDALIRILNFDYQENLQQFTCSNYGFSQSDLTSLLQNIGDDWNLDVSYKKEWNQLSLQFTKNN